MDFRKDHETSLEQEEIAHLQKELRRVKQKAAFLELENQILRQTGGRGNHGQEGAGNFLGTPFFLAGDEEQLESVVPGQYPHEELPNLEDEEFHGVDMLLDGGEDEKQMDNDKWKMDASYQEEEHEKNQRFESTDEGLCFCSSTSVSESDVSEHYKHCPEYNRWTGSENNPFYSPQYSLSSYSLNCSPTAWGSLCERNGLPNRPSY